MAKPKKELTPMEALHKEFMSDFNDNELQERFNNFEKNVKYWKGLYNDLVPKINDNINKKNTLVALIVECAKLDMLNTDAVNQLKETEKYLDEWFSKADEYRAKFEEEDALIKKYKEGSHNRLFNWWKAFRAIDPKTEPWLEWSKPYSNRIF